MDRTVTETFLAKLLPTEKATFILFVMYELTLTVRALFYDNESPCEQRLKAMYRISEMNHRLTSAAWRRLQGAETYSDDALLQLILEHPDLPELEPSCREALEHALSQVKALPTAGH